MITLLATPIQSVYSDSYYATLDGDLVTIYLTDTDDELDTFTMDEYCEIISEGTLDTDTRRLTINW